MALGKTITYTPFQETSFGYGSGEIASAHSTEFPNATDIVKVVIDFTTGTNWDYTTGHIATPSVGTAVSTFNKYNMEWLVRGERDDVDAVLAQLKFFPSDYEETRTWTPTALKDNQTTGLYANEEPPTIPDTQMGLRVYDANDSLVQLHTIIWEADNYSYDNNRPYWSVEPTSQDVSSLGIPPLIDLGTIANSTDENLTVKCEFRHYDSTSTYTGSAYGQFTQQDRFYVGDKKEAQRNTTDARFNFTGSLTETQAFLDNIGYQGNTRTAFDMFLTVTDGAVGSTVTKTCWFSDAPFTVSHQIPDYIATEEDFFTPLEIDDNFTITHSPEVNRYWFTITLDATGQDGVTYMSEGTLSNGVFTSDYSYSLLSLRSLMMTMGMQFRDDFNDDFTFTIQWHGDNTTIDSSYSSAIQTVNVTVLDAVEITNLYTSHNFEEDHRYYFANGAGLPNIAGDSVLYNREYTARITASDPNAVEIIWLYVPNSSYTHGVDFFWENGNQLRMVGTRDEVNEMLNGVYFDAATDYDQNFTFSYHQTRLSGDTTSDEAEGDFYNIEIGANNCISMTCAVSHDEYSFTPSTQDWEEDVSKIFDTGIRVTDLSDEHENTASYGTTYTVYMKMLDMYGNLYNYGYLNSTSTGGAIGNAGGANPKTYTGTKAQVNQAIANMKYVPSPDVIDGFWIQFKIVRDFDSAVLADYSDTRQIQFNTASAHDEYSIASTSYSWFEDVPFDFDSGLQITDLADLNPDMSTYLSGYEVSARAMYFDGIANQPLTTATFTSTNYGNSLVSGSGTSADPLIISGSKSNVNLALQNLKMTVNIDDLDWTDAPSADGSFFLEYQIKRIADNSIILDYTERTNFNAGTPESQFYVPWYSFYTEDIREQYVFSGISAITDSAPNNYSGITYRVTVRMDPTNLGAFYTEYVDEDFVDVDYYSTDTDSLTFEGTKSAVNSAIQNIRFSPVADTNQSISIYYSQDRYINGVFDVSHASDVLVTTMDAIPVAEAVMGTAYNNIQYAVDANTVFAVGFFNPTPRNLRNEVSGSGNYERPFTIIDSFEEEAGPSEYKVTFTNINGLDLYDSNGVLTNGVLDYRSKTDIHAELNNGIKVHGLTADRTLNFTITRRTHSGVEKDIYSGTLDYVYLYNPPLYYGSTGNWIQITGGENVYVPYGGWIDLHIDSNQWTPPTGFDIASSIKTMTISGGSSQGSYTESATAADVGMRYFSSYTNAIAQVQTEWGAQVLWQNIDVTVMQYASRQDSFNYSNDLADDRSRIAQSNYWDGTYVNIGQLAVGFGTGGSFGGTYLDSDVNQSDRFVVNKVAPPTYNGAASEDFLTEGAYDRALVNGSDSKFYAFYCSVDSNNDRFLNVNVWNSTTATSVSSSLQHQIMTNFAGTHEKVSVAQVLYDPANEDTYLTILADSRLNEYPTTTVDDPVSVILVKMHWDGTNYSFTTLKTIPILSSSEKYNVEVYLTDDFSRLITIQSEYDIKSPYNTTTYDRTAHSGSNRIRVYDKDTGGTNNWGLTTTTTKTTQASSRYVGNIIEGKPLTSKRTGYHDVNYCDINGSDTVITSGGYIFKKDQGGTDNWGEYDTLYVRSNTEVKIIKYTQNVIFATDGEYVRVYDKTSFVPYSNPIVNLDNIIMLEASRSNNIVGVRHGTLGTGSPNTYKFSIYQT